MTSMITGKIRYSESEIINGGSAVYYFTRTTSKISYKKLHSAYNKWLKAEREEFN